MELTRNETSYRLKRFIFRQYCISLVYVSTQHIDPLSPDRSNAPGVYVFL